MKRHFLLFLILLLLLPLCASADTYTPKYNHQPVSADRILYTLPVGIKLAQAPLKENGRLTLVIDAENTDWSSVIASMTDSNRVELALGATPPAGAHNQKNMGLGNGYDPSEGTLLEQALREFDMAAKSEISRPNPPGPLDDWNSTDIARFDADSSSIVPETLDEYHYYAHLVIWNADSANPICEYFFVDVRFTDDSARKVDVKEISRSRIIPHQAEQLSVSVNNGSVSYQLPINHKLPRLNTAVIAPTGAKCYALFSASGVSEPMPLESLSSSRGAVLNTKIHNKDDAMMQTATLLWYADEEGKDLLSIERLKLQITVGDPQPYPRYIDELKPVSADRLLVPLYLSDGSQHADFINMRYIDDTYRITVEPGQIPETIDLDDCAYQFFVVPPKGATCYVAHSSSSDDIYGSVDKRYEEAVEELTNPDYRTDEFMIENGKTVAPFGSPMLATSRSFSHDPDLKLYTPTSITGQYAGGVTLIYWYDSFDPDAEPILKEYYITKTDPFSVVKTQEALTDESQLPDPDTMLLPIIILDDEDTHVNQGRKLYLAIENHVYAGKNCVVYGLHVQDENQQKVTLRKDATIVLPYPKGMGMGSPGSFTLNHYDEENGVVRYSEDSTNPKYLLTRIPHGISFKNQTFSPFVLSWETIEDEIVTDPTGADTLPQTGDHSPSLLLMFGFLLLSVLGALSLRKSRA